MSIPIFDPVSHSTSSSHLINRPNRAAEVMDSLVFMIAGLLIPAWLLGHLFLAVYQAPKAVAGSSNGPESSVTRDAELDGTPTGESDGSSTAVSATNNDSSLGNSDELSANNALKGKFDSLTGEFNALLSKSTQLESDIAALNKTNADLMAENSALKSQTSGNSNGLMLQDNSGTSTLVEELRTKFDSASQQLASTQQSLQDARTQLESTESEKRALQSDLDGVRMQLQQAETNLAAAKTSGDDMEIKPEGGDSPFALLSPEDSSPKTELAAETNARVAELEEKIKQIDLSLANANQAVAAREKELQDRENELQTTQRSMEDMRAQMARSIEELRTQNNELQSALEVSRQKAAASQNSVANQLPKEVYRDFVSSKGSISKMAFIRWEGEDIIVRSFTNKKLYRLTLDRFSGPDQQYLLEKK